MATRVVYASVTTDAYQTGNVKAFSSLPCGRSVTGFWSREPEHTANLLRAIEGEMEHVFGGGVWPRELVVLIAEENDLTITEPPARGGNAYVKAFDGSELFASEVRAYTWMYWQEWIDRLGR